MSNSSSPPPPPSPPTASDPPPPTYAPSQPQILVTPLPDAASFFWGRTVQGEIYVKGLGEGRGSRIGIVDRLSVQLHLTNHLPRHPTLSLHEFPPQILYPPTSSTNISSSTPSSTDVPFSTAHRFSIQLPSCLNQGPAALGASEWTFASESGPSRRPLPGTLNLSPYERGEVRWSLQVTLVLPSGQTVVEEVRVEGTPQEAASEHSTLSPAGDGVDPDTSRTEVEERLQQGGVLARLLIDQDTPRLGDLLRLGVEIRPQERKKTGVAGLSAQPNPAETLRPLRRVRVELFRKITIHLNAQPSSQASSSSSSQPGNQSTIEHLTLLHASGKSLRYPGSGRVHPPLRVLFTVPTAQSGIVAEQTWGEITAITPYHHTIFFLRVTVGFGEPSSALNDWTLQREIRIRPKKWSEPTQVLVERGLEPALGNSIDEHGAVCTVEGLHEGQIRGGSDVERQGSWSEEDMRREAYRQKGRDVVGATGTFRPFTSSASDDLPPPFEGHHHNDPISTGEPGPSTSGTASASGSATGITLPTFLESEEQARTGELPVLGGEVVRSERLVPVCFEEPELGLEPGPGEEGFDRANWVGRRGSLGGELGTWIEYDGYETFSMAPPTLAASYGVGGSMDPPQEGDEANNVVDGMVARLGLDMEIDGEGGSVGPGSVGRGTGLQLMEQLGLGEGTRVVDLQDDLPPGIDEPSLPALPDFHAHPPSHPRGHTHPTYSPPPATHSPELPSHDPPSFDASQAASAVGGVATSHPRSASLGPLPPVTPSTGSPGIGSIGVPSAGAGAGVVASGVGSGVGARRPSRHAIDADVDVAVVVGGHEHHEAPPGYERAGGEAGLPPYS
ncbi:hypothetical protein I316_00759 [Kwoniella heveanensis BCC8398]|uniref:Uncharacterized protein n=1 Tax=Kwoniella heveanensis BCC8398 TaxID=1296120 RepID=A0A1B9H2Y9_9TREE|nr:hypothetical protein I316_00759 [Kwoniella heveanensis BCC8398]